jgi:type IV pilus assembly protein PilC
MSTIYDSGMPLLQGLELVQKTTGIIVYRESLGFVLQHVADGEALKDALTQTGMFPPVLLQLLAAGEESGEIAKMLDWAAKICEQNLDQSIETFLELLQPFILILIGGIVGFLLIATLAPMLKVINGIT